MAIFGEPAKTTGLGPIVEVGTKTNLLTGETTPIFDHVEEKKTNGEPVKAKRGPEAPTNVLHDYSNVSYKISFMRWKSIKDYNTHALKGNWQSLKKMDDKEILFASGGVNNDHRNEHFDQDFHITSLSLDGVMYPTRDSRSTNITKGILTVTEPNGITLFERLQEVFKESGSWHEHPFLIKIEFIGYDDSGNPKLIDKATRFVPVKISNMETDYQGGVTTYTIHVYLFCEHRAGDPRHSYVKAETYKGSTVKEVLDSIANSYNKEQEKQKSQARGSGPDDGSRPITHTVSNKITFHIDPKIANSKLNLHIANKTTLTKKVEKPLSMKESAATSDRFSERIRSKTVDVNAYNSNIKVELDKNIIRVEQAAGLIDVVEKILLYSDYTINQLNEPENIDPTKIGQQALKNPDNGWDYWSISFVKELLEWDNIRNTYGVHLHVYINEFNIMQPDLTGTTKTPGDGFPDIVRNYNYLFTGNNTDIISFDTKLNREFMMTVIASTLTPDGDQTITDPKNPKTASSGDEGSVIAGQQRNPAGASQTGLSQTDNVKQNQANTLLENLYQRTGGGLVSGDLQIVGDPAFIYQDGVAVFGNNRDTNGDRRIDPVNGAIITHKGETHIYITYLTPDDYDEATGQVNYGAVNKKFRYSVLKGYYAVVRVTNTFNKGVFEQTLNVYRMYDQKPENKFTGKQRTDPEAGTVFTDVKLDSYLDPENPSALDVIIGGSPPIPTEKELENTTIDNGIEDSDVEAEIEDIKPDEYDRLFGESSSAAEDVNTPPLSPANRDEIPPPVPLIISPAENAEIDKAFRNVDRVTITGAHTQLTQEGTRLTYAAHNLSTDDVLEISRLTRAESRTAQSLIDANSREEKVVWRAIGQSTSEKTKQVFAKGGHDYLTWDDLGLFPEFKE